MKTAAEELLNRLRIMGFTFKRILLYIEAPKAQQKAADNDSSSPITYRFTV